MSSYTAKKIEEIENKVKQQALIKLRIKELNNLLMNAAVSIDEHRIVTDEIKHLENQLLNAESQSIDTVVNNCNDINADENDIKNAKVTYLIENFIVKHEITMIAAKPSSGKSLTTLAIANMVLTDDRIKYVFYFDLDNSITTLGDRNLGALREKWDKRLQYIHPKYATKTQIWGLINQLRKTDLSETLIIFDSAKNFMLNGDRDKNKDVSALMDIFKSMRNKNGTVIFLHHTNKPKQDLAELIYAGSSAWEEDSSNAFLLNQNEYKKSFIFSHFKKRVGEINNHAYSYKNNNFLMKMNYLESIETQEVEDINNTIKDFIEIQSQKPSYTQIMQHLNKEGFARNKSNEALQNGKDRYWSETKLTQNNKSVFTLIKQHIEMI